MPNLGSPQFLTQVSQSLWASGRKSEEKKEKRSKTDFVELTVCGLHFIDFLFINILFLKDEKRYLNLKIPLTKLNICVEVNP